MALTPLFTGLLALLWLGLGTLGWLIACVRRPARANARAWGVALVIAVAGGIAPALLGWRTFPALLCGAATGFLAAALVAVVLTR